MNMNVNEVVREYDLREKVYYIKGLDCSACARQLETVIGRLKGVEECIVSYITGKMHLRYRGSLEEVHRLTRAYGYRLQECGEETGTAVAVRRILRAAAAGMGLFAALLSLKYFPGLTVYLLLFSTIAGGLTTYRRAWVSLRQKQPDMNVLMTVAVIGAMLSGDFWEGAVVAFLFAVGNALETFTTEKIRRRIRALIRSVPRTAHRLQDGNLMTVPVEEIREGDTILVRPGENLPLDGEVIDGASYVTEAAITGEPLPVEKKKGSAVYAGTLNGDGVLTVRVASTWQDSTLARIIKLVEDAQERHVPAQRFTDRFAAVYTPAVLLLAAVITILDIARGSVWNQSLQRGLTLLLVACPCALVLAAPVPAAAALANAARSGVLIKGAAYLEALGKAEAIVFDKTGTLTAGEPQVTQVIMFAGEGEKQVLALASGLEAYSEHLLAGAVRKKAEAEGVKPESFTDLAVFPGRGIKGKRGKETYLLGSPAFLESEGINALPLGDIARMGETVIALSGNGKLLAALLVSDPLREESGDVVGSLRRLGIKSIEMLTGDRKEAAAAVAERLGFNEFSGEMLPEEKEKYIRLLAEKGRHVVMIGDGINDAPALASATVGIAMGAVGSPAAMETADAALMGDDLRKIPYVICLSRKTSAVIRQNIILSLLIKGTAILLAFLGLLTLWPAVLADTGTSLLVTLNGMRLLAYRASGK